MTLLAAPPPTPTPSRRQRRLRWRMPKLPLLIALVAGVGVAVLLFPTAAAWVMQYQQSQLIDEYSAEVRELSPDNRAEAIREASAYNATLVGGATVGANERIPLALDEADAAAIDYSALLAADSDGLMARVKIPAIDADLPIYHGTSEDVLQKGVGHLQGTSLPVGGRDTHSILTAHRGLATAELFTNLDRVRVGDTFTIEVFGEVLTYQVRETQVVEPDQTETLYPQLGNDLVTLVTCTPLGINSHRILVTGERILPTPLADLDAAGARPDVPGFPWWLAGIGVTLVVLAVYVYVSGRPRRPAARPEALDGPTTPLRLRKGSEG